MTINSEEKRIKDIPICEIAGAIRENLHAMGVVVIIDYDGGDGGESDFP